MNIICIVLLKQEGLTLITKQPQALQFLSGETSLSGFQHGICMAKSLLSIAECLCDGLVGIGPEKVNYDVIIKRRSFRSYAWLNFSPSSKNPACLEDSGYRVYSYSRLQPAWTMNGCFSQNCVCFQEADDLSGSNLCNSAIFT